MRKTCSQEYNIYYCGSSERKCRSSTATLLQRPPKQQSNCAKLKFRVSRDEIGQQQRHPTQTQPLTAGKLEAHLSGANHQRAPAATQPAAATSDASDASGRQQGQRQAKAQRQEVDRSQFPNHDIKFAPN